MDPLIADLLVPYAKAAPCLSQVQVIGSHNSYHQSPPKAILDFLNDPLAKAVVPPTGYLPQAWEYTHADLKSELDAGVRAFELDVHPDPVGGLYSTPGMLKFAGADPRLNDTSLMNPGYKVLHVPDIDFATSCTTLVACLTIIKDWSVAHPTHVPITILLETSFGTTDLVTMLGDIGVNVVNSQLAASTLPGPKA